MTMFDLLASADLLVDDASAAAQRLQRALGVLPARGLWLQQWPAWGFEAHWCRVARQLDRAPTHIEIIAPSGTPDPAVDHPHIADLYQSQAPRAYRTHSTPVAVADLDALLARLDEAQAPYRLDLPAEELPFPRLWLGRSAECPGLYDPRADGGLYLELLPTSSLGIPILTEPVAPAAKPGDGLVRVAARMMLVDDVNKVLQILQRTLGWEPEQAPTLERGALRARLGFRHTHSAHLELVEPVVPDTPETGYLQRWGTGPYGIRLEVDDLAESRARLAVNSIPCHNLETPGGPMVLPWPKYFYGVQFELVQAWP
jgi:hypothetical protein